MKIERTEIEGVFIIDNFNATDGRGSFIKTFNSNTFKDNRLDFEIRESYYSVSKKNVIRGMHFQLPNNDHEKLVYVPRGSILDVIVDLRKKSQTYKQHISINLSDKNKKSIYIPKGLAHGFKSLENETITVYNVATEYSAASDMGIKYDSFGFDWEVDKPILSARDLSFNTLEDFNDINPF
jgi:dTDP-4-dehydrorhamnose 3,5-epimerase/CDP-3, 6-dideoxy-D-glycero-D-glycero-4-hexulose-5-epimerase